jgi:hypothetical protein
MNGRYLPTAEIPGADEVVVAAATDPQTLKGITENVDLVVSALGITRQQDNLRNWDVDYMANKNLFDEAVAGGAKHFCYIHVFNGKLMSASEVSAIQSKEAFVD